MDPRAALSNHREKGCKIDLWGQEVTSCLFDISFFPLSLTNFIPRSGFLSYQPAGETQTSLSCSTSYLMFLCAPDSVCWHEDNMKQAVVPPLNPAAHITTLGNIQYFQCFQFWSWIEEFTNNMTPQRSTLPCDIVDSCWCCIHYFL